MITKPSVKRLKEQQELVELANQYNVLVQVEFHKRFDPIYAGKFHLISYFYSI
jgi:D-galacturonate reductase